MSRTPASYSMPVVRGQTWEDYFDYVEDDEVTPIDLTGYQALMQIRPVEDQFGTTTATTLLLELDTTAPGGLLVIETPEGGNVPNRIRIAVPPDQHAMLNPENAKAVKYAYALEVFQPEDGSTPRYSLPLVAGKISAQGWLIR